MSKTQTQNERVLDYMREHGSITQLQAMQDLGVMRLASRIADLRRQGYTIIAATEKVTHRFGEPCHVSKYSEIQRDSV